MTTTTTENAVALPTSATSFFVTGLSWWTQDIEVEAAFAELGPVDRVEPVDETSTGKFTGRSLVIFLSADDATNARRFLSNRGMLCGQRIQIQSFSGGPKPGTGPRRSPQVGPHHAQQQQQTTRPNGSNTASFSSPVTATKVGNASAQQNPQPNTSAAAKTGNAPRGSPPLGPTGIPVAPGFNGPGVGWGAQPPQNAFGYTPGNEYFDPNAGYYNAPQQQFWGAPGAQQGYYYGRGPPPPARPPGAGRGPPPRGSW